MKHSPRPIEAVEEITTSAAARALSVSEATVRLMVTRGELPCRRLANGLRLYGIEDVARLRAKREQTGE
jgi:DNA-binding transcriptional MerR regulator